MTKALIQTHSSEYRTEGNNIYMTRSLFGDVDNHNNLNPPFWLRSKPKDCDKPCFKDIYLFLEDETGYELAIKYLGSYDHWLYLLKHSVWFRDEIEVWKNELRTKLKARAMDSIISLVSNSEEPTNLRFAAAKWLHEKVSAEEAPAPAKRGRPSKVEIKGALKKAVDADKETLEDLERIKRFN